MIRHPQGWIQPHSRQRDPVDSFLPQICLPFLLFIVAQFVMGSSQQQQPNKVMSSGVWWINLTTIFANFFIDEMIAVSYLWGPAQFFL